MNICKEDYLCISALDFLLDLLEVMKELFNPIRKSQDSIDRAGELVQHVKIAVNYARSFITEHTSTELIEIILTLMIRVANYSSIIGDLKIYVDYLHEARLMCEKRGLTESPVYAQTLHYQGSSNFHASLGRYTEAIENFERSYKLKKGMPGNAKNPDDTLFTYQCLASTHAQYADYLERNRGDKEKIGKHRGRAVKIFRKLEADEAYMAKPFRESNLHINFACLLEVQGQFKDAKKKYKQGIRVLRKHDERHNQLPWMYNNLGDFYLKKRTDKPAKFAKAEKCYEEAERVCSKVDAMKTSRDRANTLYGSLCARGK